MLAALFDFTYIILIFILLLECKLPLVLAAFI
jgi:hypothetical protein